MRDVYEVLGEAFHEIPEELETKLTEMGISFKGYTIHVTFAKIISKEKTKTKITPKDVVEYYVHEAGNSGCRTLGTIVGDWRPIDELAKQCLQIYKVLKKPELKFIAKKYDMELKE